MENLTFEQAMAELEKIVNELSSGGAALEKTVELYEKGAALADYCAGLLKCYDGRIEQAMKKTDLISGEEEK